MERLHSGDPSALDDLLERYWHPLVAYASRILSDRDAAEDVVQDAMLRVWNERKSWTPSERLKGFLYQITRNLALNEKEKRQVRSRWVDSARSEPRRPVPTPHDLAEGAELQEFLDRAVDALPPGRREVFTLARYHGHTYGEISRIMNISPQTVANQMSAALESLRETLRPQVDAFLARGKLRVVRDDDPTTLPR
jgi:RNA polymerase sigma-70 factor, ECF subfamily